MNDSSLNYDQTAIVVRAVEKGTRYPDKNEIVLHDRFVRYTRRLITPRKDEDMVDNVKYLGTDICCETRWTERILFDEI